MRTTQDDALAVAARIGRGASALAARTRAEQAGVLTLTETAVLGRLWSAGEMTPRELADRLRLRPQSLTRTLSSLEAGGQLRRTPDPADGRQSLLAITDAGVRALDAEMRPRDRWLAGVITRELSDAERDLLLVAATLMERLAQVDARAAKVEP